MDEQRVDNCRVPMDRSGTKPRLNTCDPVSMGCQRAQRCRNGSDPDKALVMKAIARLVRQGCAELAVLESGKTRLRLKTGEVFHLGEQAITRIA